MRKNDGLEILAAANGYWVSSSRMNGDDYGRLRKKPLVFETRAALLAYLRRHFDEAQPPKFEAETKK